MKKNQVILLYGMPASGKYTMAAKIRSTGGVLLDNHYFHDMFKDIIEVPAEEKSAYFESVGVLKQDFMNILRRFYPRDRYTRYIFTSFILKDESFAAELEQFAKDIDADFIPIELHTAPDALIERCQTEYRKSRKKICTAQKMRDIINLHADNLLQYDHPNKLLIDTGALDEERSFELIRKHLLHFEA